MKTRLLLAAMALAGIAGMAQADEVDLKNYRMAREYIKKEKVTVTVTVEQAFAQDAILVVGEGVPKKGTSGAQRRLTAMRAAEVAAQRSLAELLRGVSIVAETTVREAEVDSDIIKSSVSAFIKDFSPVVKDWNEREETALVILKVGVNGPGSFGAMMYEKILNEPKIKEAVEKPAYVPPVDVALPPPAPQAYDGLIIDATEQPFRPALINRIFNPGGQVLYDPARISQKVLVEQGCGEYTNSVDKARAALGKRGVKNPLVVKASGTVTPSDLQVSNEIAAQIFAANQTSGFMADARVAFVLK